MLATAAVIYWMMTLVAGADALLFDCSQPEAMNEALIAARRIIAAAVKPDTGLGVEANAFKPEPPTEGPYAGISEIRTDLDPENYLKWVRRWIGLGATIAGGCCGIGPEHIAAISQARNTRL